MCEFHGDEDEIDIQKKELDELYESANSSNYKYTEEWLHEEVQS